MKKRIAIFLCFILLLSLLPVVTFAAPTDAATSIVIGTTTLNAGDAISGPNNASAALDSNGTLTLKNYKQAGDVLTWDDGYLNLVLEGDCELKSIEAAQNGSCGVLTISGSGTLTLEGTDICINLTKDFVLEEASVTVKNTDTQSGVFVAGNITVKNGGALYATAPKYGIYAANDITLESGTIYAEVNGDSEAILSRDMINMEGGSMSAINHGLDTANTDAISAEDGIVMTGGVMTGTGGRYGITAKGNVTVTGSANSTPLITAEGKYGIYIYGDTSILTLTNADVTATGTSSGTACDGSIHVVDSDLRSVGTAVGIMALSLEVSGYSNVYATATGAPKSEIVEEPCGAGIYVSGAIGTKLKVDLSKGGVVEAIGMRGRAKVVGNVMENFGGGIVFKNDSDVSLGNLTKIYDNQTLVAGAAGDGFAKAYGKDGVVAEETVLYAGVTIKATAGAGGSITPKGESEVIPGRDYTYTMTPNDGYQVKDVLIDGVSKGWMMNYTFINVSTDHTIEVVFEEVVMPSITISGPTTVKVGEKFTLTVNQQGGDWEYDEAYLSYKDGVFTALKAGKTTITYKGDGVVGTHVLTITDGSPAPKTGDSTGGMLVLLVSLLGALAGATVLQRRKRTS